ncbi:heavy-metal-associated domain-containing protein [Halanaerobium hydrogeniformans]|uniref:Heavy metal transport/detoxification protein n=1 Tax=Halanaerobium hydrogeniformans TaxID=656519 RepID=E4RIR5_HALHG|nr:cation transporter [Halanaerobium hydrogeniformans]ADQ15135.1 Heavy metal transport/detoxification protein [Halanaerobium hydrogeniformans]
MKKTIIIEGMSCGHCEKRVKKALEDFAEIESAEVSADNDQAVIDLNKAAEEDKLAAAIEAVGYKFIKIV